MVLGGRVNIKPFILPDFGKVETDYFQQTLLPELHKLGFAGIHQQKALGIKEGVATFYRSERFTLERQEGAHFKDWIAEV